MSGDYGKDLIDGGTGKDGYLTALDYGGGHLVRGGLGRGRCDIDPGDRVVSAEWTTTGPHRYPCDPGGEPTGQSCERPIAT